MNSSIDNIDEGTICAAQEGCQESLARIAHVAQGKVYAFLFRLTLDHHLAEDLCQETLLHLVKTIENLDFPNEKALWAWLFRMALGKVQHHHRIQGNQRIHHKTHFNAEALTHIQAGDEARPDHGLFRRETLDTLMQAMDSLKEEYRAVLTLRCFDELSYAQIATVLGGSQLRNKMLFYRARQALKQRLHDQGLGQMGLMAALGVFASLTRPASQTSAAIPAIQASSLKVGGTIIAVCVLTQTSVLVSLATLLVLGWTGTHLLQPKAKPPHKFEGIALWRLPQNNGYARPTTLKTSDPQWQGFQGVVGLGQEAHVQTVDPAEMLVGSAGDRNLSVILKEGQSIEVTFERPLYTGQAEAPHFFYTGWQCQVLRVFLTDGADQEFELPTPHCVMQDGESAERCAGYHIVPFDLDGLNIPFIPTAVRLQGTDYQRRYEGFELTSVRAMIVPETQD